MKIIFFGTAEFAVPSLKALTRSEHTLLAVVTQPDKKAGRKLKMTAPPVKQAASGSAIPLFQPKNVSAKESIAYLKTLKPDLFVVAAFGQILSEELLSVPKRCALNIHGSILPRYRGAAPVNWAIIRDDRRTGVTIIKMNRYMDAGEIILSEEIDIGAEDTGITLGNRLALLGAELILNALRLIEQGAATFTGQDERSVTYAPKLRKNDGKIDWRKSALEIHNLARGLLPWPGAFTYFRGRTLKIIETEVFEASIDNAVTAGAIAEIIKGRGILVGTGSHFLLIKRLQLEGKKELSADEFLRGFRLHRGDKLGLPA